jgi:hypothetical protein
MAKAEDRLARTEGLLADVGSSFAALQEQKGLVDQAVEKVGSLQFLLKQAEAAIDGLKEQRKTKARGQAAARQGSRADDSEELAEAA